MGERGGKNQEMVGGWVGGLAGVRVGVAARAGRLSCPKVPTPSVVDPDAGHARDAGDHRARRAARGPITVDGPLLPGRSSGRRCRMRLWLRSST